MFTLIYHYLSQDLVVGFFLLALVVFNIVLCFLNTNHKWLWRIGITLFGCDLIGVVKPEYGLGILSAFAIVFGGIWILRWALSGWDKYETFFIVFWW